MEVQDSMKMKENRAVNISRQSVAHIMTEIDEATDNEMDNTFNVDGNISSRIGVGLKSVSILGSNQLHTKKFDKFAFAKKFEITKDEVCFMTEPILELQ